MAQAMRRARQVSEVKDVLTVKRVAALQLRLQRRGLFFAT